MIGCRVVPYLFSQRSETVVTGTTLKRNAVYPVGADLEEFLIVVVAIDIRFEMEDDDQ